MTWKYTVTQSAKKATGMLKLEKTGEKAGGNLGQKHLQQTSETQNENPRLSPLELTLTFLI